MSDLPMVGRSISRHLSAYLVLLTLLGLGFVSIVVYSATAMRLHAAQEEALDDKRKLLSEFVRIACLKGEVELRRGGVLHRLRGRIGLWPFDPVPEDGPLFVEIYTALAAREAGRLLLEDEARFIDLAASPLWLGREHAIVE